MQGSRARSMCVCRRGTPHWQRTRTRSKHERSIRRSPRPTMRSSTTSSAASSTARSARPAPQQAAPARPPRAPAAAATAARPVKKKRGSMLPCVAAPAAGGGPRAAHRGGGGECWRRCLHDRGVVRLAARAAPGARARANQRTPLLPAAPFTCAHNAHTPAHNAADAPDHGRQRRVPAAPAHRAHPRPVCVCGGGGGMPHALTLTLFVDGRPIMGRMAAYAAARCSSSSSNRACWAWHQAPSATQQQAAACAGQHLEAAAAAAPQARGVSVAGWAVARAWGAVSRRRQLRRPRSSRVHARAPQHGRAAAHHCITSLACLRPCVSARALMCGRTNAL
jgi:hypothetical protein